MTDALISIVDNDTGESVLHAKRVPEGFSIQLAYRAKAEEGSEYISIVLYPESAVLLAEFLASGTSDDD